VPFLNLSSHSFSLSLNLYLFCLVLDFALLLQCARGWDPSANPGLNPSGARCTAREYINHGSDSAVTAGLSALRLLGDSGDHVDIIGNVDVIADVIKIAARASPEAVARNRQAADDAAAAAEAARKVAAAAAEAEATAPSVIDASSSANSVVNNGDSDGDRTLSADITAEGAVKTNSRNNGNKTKSNSAGIAANNTNSTSVVANVSIAASSATATTAATTTVAVGTVDATGVARGSFNGYALQEGEAVDGEGRFTLPEQIYSCIREIAAKVRPPKPLG